MPEIIKNQLKLKNRMILPIAATIIAVLLWGLSFAGMRIVLSELSPMTVIWSRMITAFIIILPFMKKMLPTDYRKGDWKLLLPMVLFQPCLYFVLETKALMLTTSTQAGVITAAVPIFVVIGARVFFKEHMAIQTIAGLSLSIAGVVLLTTGQGTSETASSPVLGNLIEVAATVFAAGNLLLIKKLSGRYSPWTLIAMQITAGVIFFSPGLFQLIKTEPSVWSLKLVLIIIYLGAFVSLGAFALHYWAISRLNVARASVFINLIPVVAIITGWVLLDESLTAVQLIAAAGVISGVILSQRSSKTAKESAAELPPSA